MNFIPCFCLAVVVVSGYPQHTQTRVTRLPTLTPIWEAPNVPFRHVVHGMPATAKSLPYQAALFMDNGRSFCAGSLISFHWVLTSAHCTYEVSSFTVYLGSTQLDSKEEGTIIIESRKKIVHEKWKVNNVSYDVALINLGQNITFPESIRPIKIAMETTPFEGGTARVSGWGRHLDRFNVHGNHLSYVDLTVIGNSECSTNYGSSITASVVCTSGYGGLGPCHGDEGGPLVDLMSGALIGVVSFVPSWGCASGYPSGYTRVPFLAAWISQKTGIAIQRE